MLEERTAAVSPDEVPALTEFLEETLMLQGAPMGVTIKMNIALDEIYSNIVKFSGASYAKITCGVEAGTATLIFEDDGVPYDPLAKEDPDTTLSAEKRDIGGLGIYMVKKSMSAMRYAYEDGKNILTLQLHF